MEGAGYTLKGGASISQCRRSWGRCTFTLLSPLPLSQFDLVGMDDLHFAVPEELGAVYMTDTFNIAEDGRVIVNVSPP